MIIEQICMLCNTAESLSFHLNILGHPVGRAEQMKVTKYQNHYGEVTELNE